MPDPILIAHCPKHGLHGERQECFVCHGPVEQVPMVPLSEHDTEIGHVIELGEKLHEAIDALAMRIPGPLGEELLSAMKAWDDLMAELFERAIEEMD